MLAHAVRRGAARVHRLTVYVIRARGDLHGPRHGMWHRGEVRALGQVRRRDQLGRAQDGRAGNARLAQHREGLLHRGEAGHPRADDLAELPAVLSPDVARLEPRIVGQLGSAHQREESRPELQRSDDLKREVPAADLVNEQAGPRVAVLRAAIEHGGEGDAVGPDQRLEHRDVEEGAAAGAPPAQEGGQDGGGGVVGGEDVGGL